MDEFDISSVVSLEAMRALLQDSPEIHSRYKFYGEGAGNHMEIVMRGCIRTRLEDIIQQFAHARPTWDTTPDHIDDLITNLGKLNVIFKEHEAMLTPWH